MVKDIALMTDEETETYISSRVSEIKKLLDDPTLPLPKCNDEELWKKGDKYAVMKDGRKTAIKVFDDKSEAEAFQMDNSGTYIQKRPGLAKRCSYCTVWKVCDQFNELNAKGEVEPQE
jgi:hypothetical protein